MLYVYLASEICTSNNKYETITRDQRRRCFIVEHQRGGQSRYLDLVGFRISMVAGLTGSKPISTIQIQVAEVIAFRLLSNSGSQLRSSPLSSNALPPSRRAMEQMERQASDLRYLVTQTPVGLSDSASAAAYETPQPHQASPGSASAGDNSALNPGGMVFAPAAPSSSSYHANKRKLADDDADPDGGPDDGDGDGDDAGGPGGQKHTRSKRNRVSTSYDSFTCPSRYWCASTAASHTPPMLLCCG